MSKESKKVKQNTEKAATAVAKEVVEISTNDLRYLCVRAAMLEVYGYAVDSAFSTEHCAECKATTLRLVITHANTLLSEFNGDSVMLSDYEISNVLNALNEIRETAIEAANDIYLSEEAA